MMVSASITSEMLDELRADLAHQMSQKRYTHTCAVEKMIQRLSDLYCPDATMELRAAALLHDLTKEESLQNQLQMCREFGIMVRSEDVLSPKTFHAKTAAAKIGRDYPSFATETVVLAVRWHTTGHAGMTLTEKLLYLADYIDDSRTFSSCVLLRRYFFGAEPELMTKEERERHLRETLLRSYEFTLKDLLADGAPIDEDSIRARNDLLLEAAREAK